VKPRTENFLQFSNHKIVNKYLIRNSYVQNRKDAKGLPFAFLPLEKLHTSNPLRFLTGASGPEARNAVGRSKTRIIEIDPHSASGEHPLKRETRWLGRSG
jgi:hypothetical protein